MQYKLLVLRKDFGGFMIDYPPTDNQNRAMQLMEHTIKLNDPKINNLAGFVMIDSDGNVTRYDPKGNLTLILELR